MFFSAQVTLAAGGTQPHPEGVRSQATAQLTLECENMDDAVTEAAARAVAAGNLIGHEGAVTISVVPLSALSG